MTSFANFSSSNSRNVFDSSAVLKPRISTLSIYACREELSGWTSTRVTVFGSVNEVYFKRRVGCKHPAYCVLIIHATMVHQWLSVVATVDAQRMLFLTAEEVSNAADRFWYKLYFQLRTAFQIWRLQYRRLHLSIPPGGYRYGNMIGHMLECAYITVSYSRFCIVMRFSPNVTFPRFKMWAISLERNSRTWAAAVSSLLASVPSPNISKSSPSVSRWKPFHPARLNINV